MPAEAHRGARALQSKESASQPRREMGARAQVGPGVPQGVMEDAMSKDKDSERQEAKAERTTSKKSLPRSSQALGTPVEQEGVEFAGKRREAVVEYSPRAPYEQVVVLDRLKDRATGITTHVIQEVLPTSEVDSRLREAASRAQSPESRERSEAAEAEDTQTRESKQERDKSA